MRDEKPSRRNFLGRVASGIAGTAGISGMTKGTPLLEVPLGEMARATPAGVPYRTLGISVEKV
ncbi:MAG TPA: twin-arginine translocation signal domain-containing protein [Terriglobia bacterium]|nr:twin-arginine translocation signal domain-containing protein [Terriglobia bacterium]